MLAAGAGTFPVLVGSSQAAPGAGGTTVTITKPSGVAAGDLMIAILAHRDAQLWTPESGWTEVGDSIVSPGVEVAWKIATGAEAADYTFTATGVGNKVGVLLAYRGAAYDAIGAFVAANAGSDVVAPSVTLSRDGLALAFFADEFGSRTFTTPSGMLALLSQSASAPSYAIFSQQLGPGATGTRTSTPSGGGNTAGVLIGIKGA